MHGLSSTLYVHPMIISRYKIFHSIHLFIYFVCVSVWVYTCQEPVGKSEDNLQEFASSFHCLDARD